MAPRKAKSSKSKKMITFMLDEEIRLRIDEYCKNSQLSLAQFIRLAIIEKLEGKVIDKSDQVEIIDTSNIDHALTQLQQEQTKISQMLEFLIDQQQKENATQSKIVIEAKQLLLEKQPTTYEEANEFIPDINTMNEAINQLLQENKVIYKRSKLNWL
ncbi:MAG: hypothetical protein ACFFB5_12705 [Promethearchaeota archaeon]